jgi:phosphatidyl-myo-inositol dimannoside synthase
VSRTLLVAANFPPVTGGASRRFWEIYRRRPAGSVTVVTGWTAAPPRSDGEGGAAVIRLSRQASARELSGAIRLWPFAAALRTVRDAVRQRGIDRIHCGRVLPEGWLTLAVHLLDGVPYDCFVFGEEINAARNGEPGGFLSSRRYRHMTRLVLAGASRLVACSDFGAGLLCEQWSIDPARVSVLKPGVDTRFFRPPSPADPPRRPDWRRRRIVLAAGRLQKRKGFDVLIRAVASLRGVIPDVLLVVAGGGEEDARLRALAAELGLDEHVSFLGEVSDEALRSCYQHCDVFVLANRQVGCDVEGFGMVLLEAQACGKPVIAGRSGGTREALLDGVTGQLVDCTKPELVAAALEALLGDPERRAAMAEAARRLMVERFQWDVVLRDTDWLFGAAETPR